MFRRLIDSLKPSPPAATPIRSVEAATIRDWWEAGAVVLIDVRESVEHQAEAIPGALNLPLSTIDPAQLPAVAPGQHLVVHCQSGVRCAPAAARLIAGGWPGEVVRMKGGITAWKDAGGPTRSGT